MSAEHKSINDISRNNNSQREDESKKDTNHNNNGNSDGDMTKCPDCGTPLQKCLIQQNYAMVLCPNETCGYPFNQHDNIENMVYVDDNDILDAARQRLAKD